MTNNENLWRTEPMYSFRDAAHLAHVSTSTVRNWTVGYSGAERQIDSPFVTGRPDGKPMVSFLQLIEIVVAAKFRKSQNVSFQRIKNAYLNSREIYGLEYPFAHRQFEALGGHIIHGIQDARGDSEYGAIDTPELFSLPGLVLDTIHQIEYDDEYELACRWFPVGNQQPIVVDPRISSGIPSVLGRGVTIQAIRKRWVAGHKIDFIAQDYDLTTDVVETALQYSEQIAA